MQLPKSVIAVSLIGLLAAACGGTTATQGPGGPGATTGNGNGNEFGSVKFTVSGPFEKNDEFAFIPAASVFGSAQGSVLNFNDTDDNSAIVSILVAADGKVVVSYSGTEGQVPAAECTTTDFKVEARSASGKFDCTSTASMSGSGAVLGPGKITGEFSARA